MTREDLVVIKNYLVELIMVLYYCILVAIQFELVETRGLKPKITVENMKKKKCCFFYEPWMKIAF